MNTNIKKYLNGKIKPYYISDNKIINDDKEIAIFGIESSDGEIKIVGIRRTDFKSDPYCIGEEEGAKNQHRGIVTKTIYYICQYCIKEHLNLKIAYNPDRFGYWEKISFNTLSLEDTCLYEKKLKKLKNRIILYLFQKKVKDLFT